MISILCNSSNEYAIHCKVMLTSLFENNKQNDKEVYVFSTSMSDENIKGFGAFRTKIRDEGSDYYCRFTKASIFANTFCIS